MDVNVISRQNCNFVYIIYSFFKCDIAECISLATGSTEVYVNLNMKHMCVSARGAKAHGCTNVTYMTPALRRNISAREEFERKSTELLKRI